MNMQHLAPRLIGKKVGQLLHRFHIIIFFLIVSAVFALAVLHLNEMLEETSVDGTYTSDIDAGSIDATTLERINTLRRSDQVVSLPKDEGLRTNPFGE
ncbi:hypothetical protein GW746_00110 [Candidatus Saccharibacteria bacterium]|nr:hypothetical protein [Candidatus Saccharibacteria bacterium]NCS82808.1 hypothetical protein [Candidatus Saccharibacteria bacterium]